MAHIHDWELDDYLHECVSVNRSDINSEFVRVSSDLAYWGEQLALAEGACAQAEAELDATTATLYTQARAVCNARAAAAVADTKYKPERVTEAAVDAEVKSSSEYRALQSTVVDCKTQKTRVKMVVEAIKTKREMLISLGAQLRSEQRGDPTILDNENDWKY